MSPSTHCFTSTQLGPNLPPSVGHWGIWGFNCFPGATRKQLQREETELLVLSPSWLKNEENVDSSSVIFMYVHCDSCQQGWVYLILASPALSITQTGQLNRDWLAIIPYWFCPSNTLQSWRGRSMFKDVKALRQRGNGLFQRAQINLRKVSLLFHHSLAHLQARLLIRTSLFQLNWSWKFA